MIKKIINPLQLFIIGGILGIICKTLDNIVGNSNIIIEQLAYTLSNFTIWVLFEIITSIYSETKKKKVIIINQYKQIIYLTNY